MFVSFFIAIIGFTIWDRKTVLVKAQEESKQLVEESKQQIKNQQTEEQSVILAIQEKIQNIVDIMKTMSESRPEMRSMMQAAQLL